MTLAKQLQDIDMDQADADTIENENFEVLDGFAVYAKNPVLTDGLTWAYYAGRWGGTAITAGTLTLVGTGSPSVTNYIVVNRSTGAITVSQTSTNWDDTTNYARVYKVVAGAGAVEDIEDHRVGSYGVVGFDGLPVVANEATDTTCFVNFTTAASGQLQIKTNTNLTFNSNTGMLTALAATITTLTATNLSSTVPTTGWYSPSADNIRSPNSVTIDDSLTVSGVGPHVIGGGALGYNRLRLGGTFTSSGASTYAAALNVDGAITGFAGDTSDLLGVYLNNTITTQGNTDTIARVAQIYIAEPSITVGAGDTITLAATAYIAGAPTEGATNAALYVASGATMLGGSLSIGSLAAANTQLHVHRPAAATSAVQMTNTSTGTAATDGLTIGITTGLLAEIWNYENADMRFGTNNGERVRIDTAGSLFVGDTSNANSTLGLTINQGANDDEILSLKSSDIAHGMTSVAETDTFARFLKFSATDGGLYVDGLADTGATGMQLRGVMVTANSTKTTGGLAAVMIDSALKSGTGVASSGANANMVAFRDNGTTRFILDADGDSHQDVGTAWTNFDHLDDIATLDAVAYNVARADDPIKRKFGDWMLEKRDSLTANKIVTFNDDGHHFVNMSKLTMLHTGALRQLGEKHEALMAELTAVKAQMKQLESKHA